MIHETSPCQRCGEPTIFGVAFCGDCRKHLLQVKDDACPRCFGPLFDPKDGVCGCCNLEDEHEKRIKAFARAPTGSQKLRFNLPWLARAIAKAMLPISYECWKSHWNRRMKKAYYGDFPRFLHYHADHANRCKRRFNEKMIEYES